MTVWNKGKTGIYSKETLEKMSKAKKGKSPWNKGKKAPQIAETLKGHYVSEETKRIISIKAKERYKDKTKHPNYQDGLSIKYKEWRTNIYKKDNYTCQGCLKRGGHLNAHHIKKQSLFPKLKYSINNGITLCRYCHFAIKGLEEIFKNLFFLINQYGTK